MEYNGNVILRGYKDSSTNLWTLPLKPTGMQFSLSQPTPIVDRTLNPNQMLHNNVNLALFMHSVRT